MPVSDKAAVVWRNGLDAGKADPVRACVLLFGNDVYQGGWDECQERAAYYNNAIAARERAAAEKALRDAAKQIEPSERKAGPGGAPGFVQGKEEGRIVAAEYLIACADALRDWREP